jgi:hypothetical protein
MIALTSNAKRGRAPGARQACHLPGTLSHFLDFGSKANELGGHQTGNYRSCVLWTTPNPFIREAVDTGVLLLGDPHPKGRSGFGHAGDTGLTHSCYLRDCALGHARVEQKRDSLSDSHFRGQTGLMGKKPRLGNRRGCGPFNVQVICHVSERTRNAPWVGRIGGVAMPFPFLRSGTTTL